MTDALPSAERFAQILDALPSVVALVDSQRRVAYLNRPAEGYDLDDALGRDSLDFVMPEYREQQAELFDRVVETGEPASYEIPLTDARGDEQWHEGTLIPVLQDGAVTGVVVETRNVTERHRAEEEAAMLRRLVPVCSWCRKVRDDDGNWIRIEEYVADVERTRVTHGMCPECRDEIDGNGPEKRKS